MFRRWLSDFITKNKEKIEQVIKVCLVAGLVIFMVYLFFANRGKENNNSSSSQKQDLYEPQETIISGSDISDEQYEENSNIVNTFIQYCNEGKVNEAYSLLTNECKENLYHNVEDFQEEYCNRYFNTKKSFNLQAWIKKDNCTTYQIRILDDILSSGKYEGGNVYQDYITIVKDGDNEKININGYIGKESINKTAEKDGIIINVLEVNRYMNFEEYTIEVTNNTENVIILDSMKNPTSTLVLVSNNNSGYSVILNSISYIELIVNPKENRQMKIQFNKKYSSETDVNKIIFSEVAKNYNEFIKDKTNYNDFTTIEVNL